MQLPSLFIRGAIATQTMSNLTEDDIARVDEIVKEIEDDPSLAGDKHEFIRQLGATIKSDYRSDPATALQEFRIAIWRATVNLLYHRDYQYICSICGATQYMTCSNKAESKVKVFDRQYKICPKCGYTHIQIDQDIIKGQVTRDRTGFKIMEGDREIASFKDRESMDKAIRSPINTITGTRKVHDPEQILGDSIQRGKWYTVWIWNYFRQILNENIIRTHNKHTIDISGKADYIAFQLIANELRRGKYKFTYDESKIADSHSEELEIFVDIMHTEDKFSKWLRTVAKEYVGHNVEISAPRPNHGTVAWASCIKIRRIAEPPVITAAIETEDPVVVLSFIGPSGSNEDGDDTNTWRDIIEFNSESQQIYDGEIDKLISDEALTIVRTHLHDDNAKRTFDILSQTGDTWTRFSNVWGSQPARKVHIAKFLNVSTRQVEMYKQMIMTQCLIHDLKASKKATQNKSLWRAMRVAEDSICRDIKGNILNICVLYRYMCLHIIKCNVVCQFGQIPQRLRSKITQEQYKAIAERTTKFVR